MATAKKTDIAPDLDPELPPRVEALRRVAAALGDERRCQLLYELRLGPRAVHQLVERTGLRQPLVSHHLGVLRRAGLVRDVPDGRLRRYCLEEDASDAARVLLQLFRVEAGERPAPSSVLGSPEELTNRQSASVDSRPVVSEMEDYLL